MADSKKGDESTPSVTLKFEGEETKVPASTLQELSEAALTALRQMFLFGTPSTATH